MALKNINEYIMNKIMATLNEKNITDVSSALLIMIILN